MVALLRKIRQVMVSPSTIYVILRYLTYAIQFLNSILLARYLGNYAFGIYSFIMLVIQCMQYSNFGLNESLNTEYALNIKHQKYANKIWNNTWTTNIIINVLLTILILSIFFKFNNLFNEYKFDQYKYQILLICIIFNLARIYITYYKLKGNLIKLNIQQLLPNISILFIIIIYGYNIKIGQIVYALLISHIISLLLFKYHIPEKPKLELDVNISWILIRKGTILLLYNFSFYLLTYLASFFISYRYSVETFGCYSFANTLVNGITMAGGAFLFIFYPKILNKLSNTNVNIIKDYLSKIKYVYIILMDCILVLSILCAILTTLIVPQYDFVMVSIFSILILGKVINNTSTGYAALMIAKKKEIYLAIYAFISLIPILIFGINIDRFNFPIIYITYCVVLSSIMYTLIVTIHANYLIEKKLLFLRSVKELISANKWFIFFFVFINSIHFNSILFYIIGVIIYYIINIKHIKYAIQIGYKVIVNKESFIIK